MTYIVTGIARETYASLFDLSDAELAARGARRVTAGADGGYPCRVSLEEARAGERLVLVNHASNAVEGPYLSAFAIFVRERAEQARYIGELPPVFKGRALSLRAYDAAGDLLAARLSPTAEEHEPTIRELLADPRVDRIDAHNAAYGCFAARIDHYRSEA
jgi:hypothetical protein